MAGDVATLHLKRVLSAVAYGAASLLITVVNKVVLTGHGFPSYQFLGLGQMLATLVVLGACKALGLIQYPGLQAKTFKVIWPLPVIYLANMISGLGGTKDLSLPMFTALRRFSIPMTMLGEWWLLNVKPSLMVNVCVLAMVGGALIAAGDDATFAVKGYALVLINDVLTASNGVFLKKKLESKAMGEYGLMYYNCLFMFVPALIIAWCTGDLTASLSFQEWTNSWFVLNFTASCIMGFVLTYSITMCTRFNGALTTTIIGCLKNVMVTYLGMIIGGDYVFTWINFAGLNISVAGSLLYTCITFKKRPETKLVLV